MKHLEIKYQHKKYHIPVSLNKSESQLEKKVTNESITQNKRDLIKKNYF